MSPAASPTVSPILWFDIYWLKDYRRKKSTLHLPEGFKPRANNVTDETNDQNQKKLFCQVSSLTIQYTVILRGPGEV